MILNRPHSASLRPILSALVLAIVAVSGPTSAQEAASRTVDSPVALPQPPPETVVRRLVAEVPPDALAERILSSPEDAGDVLGPLAAVLELEGYAGSVPTYVASTARSLGDRIARRGPPWPEEDIDLLLSVLLVNPGRWAEDARFRGLVSSILPWALERSTPIRFRDRLLVELNRIRGVDFEVSENVEVAWGAAPRRSAAYEVSVPDAELEIRAEGPIATTVLSLPSHYFSPGAAEALLAALESGAPGRELLVLTDLPMKEALADGRKPTTHLLETHGRPYSPWMRDPLLLTRHRTGGVVLLQRPNHQLDREEDSLLGRELLQQLPESVLERWRRTGWQTAGTPFHNGHILLTDDAAWISLNSIEDAILERLELDRVPVESFSAAETVDAYLGAARAAAAGLESLFQRPVRFVHGLPDSGTPRERLEAMMRIGGGAGFDLDSVLTILPGDRPTALVADLDAGAELLRDLDAEDRDSLLAGYGLRGTVSDVVAAIEAHGRSSRGRRLDAFLEGVARSLANEGLRVERLPHLLVPTSLLTESVSSQDFQITWNNVVASTDGSRRRAEGFGSLLRAGDEIAQRAFSRAGYRLQLLPPLVASVIRSGGYRCASNHLRAPAGSGDSHTPEG